MTVLALERRKPVWIALSDLWLDAEIEGGWAEYIAETIKYSEYTETEINDIFTYELAPFLYVNHLDVAGEWAGFDPDWVCDQATKRLGSKNMFWKVADRIGFSTYAAREAFEIVKKIAFKSD